MAFLYRAAVAAIGLTIVLLIEGGLMWWGEPNLTELLDNIHDYGYNNLILNMYKSDKKNQRQRQPVLETETPNYSSTKCR